MADNYAITAGSGTTIAADEVGGAKYQRVKLALGADGTTVDAGAGAGAVGTDTQRVTLGSDDPAVTILTALQKAEDAAHSSGDKGIQALSVRKDTAAAVSGTDGDYQPLITDANGRLHVIDVTGTSVQFAEDAAHSSGDKGVMALSVRKNTAAATSGSDGDYQPLLTDTNGRLHVIEPSAATIAALSKAEDAAHSSGDTGVVSLAKRTDSPAVSSGTDGDYSTLNVDAEGKLWVATPQTVLSVTPTISASPDYSAGDAIGGKQTLTSAVLVSGGVSVLDSLVVIDKANQSPQFDVLIFDADPSAATITDNSAFVFSTDISKLIARVPVVTANWQSIDSVAIASLGNLGIKLKASGTANLFAAVVARGAYNAASTGDLIFKYGLEKK